MSFLQALRKLVLGETWTLPVGIGVAVGVAAGLRVLVGAGGWWADAGGLVLLVGLVGALIAALPWRG
ncbi:MAG TPA: hypothetical protein VGN69_06740 [Solirubrobacteraceae bacterium]|nr:hypothetical protein [Solirubrobacteraceae bacterium]